MAKLIDIADRLLDLYYQNYPENDSFIDRDDFKFQIATTYCSLLNAQYQLVRKENKAMDGFSNVEVPAQWLLTQTIKLEKDPDRQGQCMATLKYPVFSFDWDNYANGLQGIHSIGKKHCTYRKIGLHERKFKQVLPVIGDILFFLNSSDKIIFWGGKEGADAVIQYVPKVEGDDNDCLLSDNFIPQITDLVLDRMFKAKNGNFTQKLDNQNQNIVPGQQVDPAVQPKV